MTRTTRVQVIRSMLTDWGEYEAQGLWGASAQRSLLGRIGKPGGSGSGLPPIWVPRDVLIIHRLIQRMRDECRAAVVYERELRRVYVTAQAPERAYRLRRAEMWLAREAFRP